MALKDELQKAIDSGNAKEELFIRKKMAQGQKATAGDYKNTDKPFSMNETLGHPLSDDYADTTTGAPAGVRAGASIKMTPQGKIGYIKQTLGDNVDVTIRDDGEVYYRPKDRGAFGQWIKFDENSVSPADFADMIGGAIEAGPAVITGTLTGNPLAVGTGAAVGTALRDAISSSLPGEDNMAAGDRAMRYGGSFALGSLAQGGANRLTGLFDAARPGNIVARSVQRSFNKPYAMQGSRLSRQTGIDFTPGQLSGSRGQLMMEGVARQHPVSADKVMQFDVNQARAAVQRLNQIMDDVTKSPSGGLTVGNKVANTFDDTVNKMVKARRAQADVDFRLVKQIAGNDPVVPTTNTQKAIQKIIEDYDVPGGGDATATLVNRLKRVSSEIGDQGMSGNQTQRLLEIYGKAAKGTGQIFKDLDKAQQRMVAGRIFGALQKDLDEAADGASGRVAQALKTARDNYRANSQQINQLEDSVLGKILGGTRQAPEKIAKKFLTMEPSEISSAMKIISKASPDTEQSVKRYMLQEAMEAATPSSSGTNAAGIMFSPNKFNSFIQKNAPKYMAAFGEDKKALVQVRQVYKALQRVSDRAGMEGSQTGRITMALDVMNGVFTHNPVSTVRAGVTILAPRKIASAMTTQKGRQALLTIARTSKPTRASIAAAGYLNGLWAAEDLAAAQYAQESGKESQQQEQTDTPPQPPQ